MKGMTKEKAALAPSWATQVTQSVFRQSWASDSVTAFCGAGKADCALSVVASGIQKLSCHYLASRRSEKARRQAFTPAARPPNLHMTLTNNQRPMTPPGHRIIPSWVRKSQPKRKPAATGLAEAFNNLALNQLDALLCRIGHPGRTDRISTSY